MKLPSTEHIEPHGEGIMTRLNWLRAGVLGANDGIISLAALLVGVAGASDTLAPILLTGIAGLLAGALSMAVGEYVSVSSQRDSEIALLAQERDELAQFPEQELEELTALYQKKGLSRETAEHVARELTAHDAFAAHADIELGIKPHELTNPWVASFASAIAFTTGAAIPLIAIIIPPPEMRIPAAFIAVLLALAVTGVISARLSGASVARVSARVILGGISAMLITFGIGRLFGVAIG